MPGTEAMRVYLDSCVPIYRIEHVAPWTMKLAQWLATAIEARCTQFWTNDKRLAGAAAGQLEVHALRA